MKKMELVIKDSTILNMINKFVQLDDNDTFISKALNSIINVSSDVLHKMIDKNKKFKQMLDNSLFIKIFKIVMDKPWIISGILLILSLFIPHSYWNNLYLVLGTFMITAFIYIKNVLFNDGKFSVRNFGLSFMIFVISVIIASFISLDKSNSIRQVLFYMTGFLSYINVASSIKTKKDLIGFCYLMFAMTVLVSLYGAYQSYKGIPVNPAYIDTELNQDMAGRVYSSLENPNNLAEFLLMMIPLCGAIILSEKKWIMKIGVAICTCIPILIMLLTGTRSAWGALGIAAFIFCFFYNKKLIPLLLVAVFAAYMVLPYVSPSIYKRINTIFYSQSDHSMSYRDTIMNATMPVLRDNSVSGIGLGSVNFSRYIANNYEFANSAPPHSHNVFIQIWVEVGLLGIISFILMILSNIIKNVISIYKSKDDYIKNILTAVICGIVGMCIMGMLDYVLFYPRVMILFFTFLAIGVSARNVKE